MLRFINNVLKRWRRATRWIKYVLGGFVLMFKLSPFYIQLMFFYIRYRKELRGCELEIKDSSFVVMSSKSAKLIQSYAVLYSILGNERLIQDLKDDIKEVKKILAHIE